MLCTTPGFQALCGLAQNQEVAVLCGGGGGVQNTH